MQHMIDSKFDDIEIIKRFSKYAEIVNLWNVKIEINAVGHFPTLASLKPEEGFAQIEGYFKILEKKIQL
jgi:hypothetical protein